MRAACPRRCQTRRLREERVDPFPNFFGTSAAAPNAAAIAALMLQAAPTLGPSGIEFLLKSTAQDIQPEFSLVDGDILDVFSADVVETLAIGVEPGFDARTGAGLVDAAAAVLAADVLGEEVASVLEVVENLEDEFAFTFPSITDSDPSAFLDVIDAFSPGRAERWAEVIEFATDFAADDTFDFIVNEIDTFFA